MEKTPRLGERVIGEVAAIMSSKGVSLLIQGGQKFHFTGFLKEYIGSF